jgi:glycosyltransferase involved in cell wall biosynthesis
MRALVVTSTFPRWEDDATPPFVRDLADLAAPGWDVTVLAPHAPGAKLHERLGLLDVRRFRYFVPASKQRLCYEGGILPNVKASWLARAQAPLLVGSELLAMRRELARQTPDLIHAHFLLPQGVVAAAAARDIPLVTTVHGSDLFALRSAPVERLRAAALSRARVVTVNGDMVKRELEARFPRLEAPIRVVPMPVDDRIFHPADAPPRRELVAFIGRLTRQKGADLLIEAISCLRARGLRVVIAGEGPERERLGELADRLGIDAAFPGPLARNAVAELLREATLAVVPSRGSEAFGLVAVEAMACGCPVVAANTGGLADLARGNIRALGDPPDDVEALAAAIDETLSDPRSARSRAAAAVAWVREHHAPAVVRGALLSVYEEAMAWA